MTAYHERRVAIYGRLNNRTVARYRRGDENDGRGACAPSTYAAQRRNEIISNRDGRGVSRQTKARDSHREEGALARRAAAVNAAANTA